MTKRYIKQKSVHTKVLIRLICVVLKKKPIQRMVIANISIKDSAQMYRPPLFPNTCILTVISVESGNGSFDSKYLKLVNFAV